VVLLELNRALAEILAAASLALGKSKAQLFKISIKEGCQLLIINQ